MISMVNKHLNNNADDRVRHRGLQNKIIQTCSTWNTIVKVIFENIKYTYKRHIQNNRKQKEQTNDSDNKQHNSQIP